MGHFVVEPSYVSAAVLEYDSLVGVLCETTDRKENLMHGNKYK